MKPWLLALCSVVWLCGAGLHRLPAQSQTQSKMLATKHNLGIGGTGTIKATKEDDICVFCHTPHVPKEFAAAELWNHKASTVQYALYSSDYLTSLNYAAPSQPSSFQALSLVS